VGIYLSPLLLTNIVQYVIVSSVEFGYCLMFDYDESNFIGIADYIDCQNTWEVLNSEFATILIDELLGFLEDFYMPL